jgi:hypothetical protein
MSLHGARARRPARFLAAHADHAPVNDLRRRLAIGGADAEQALDAPDHAADRRADDGADRARDPVAFIRTMDETAGNALRLRRERESDGGDNDGYAQQLRFHATPLCFVWDGARRQPSLAIE